MKNKVFVWSVGAVMVATWVAVILALATNSWAYDSDSDSDSGRGSCVSRCVAECLDDTTTGFDDRACGRQCRERCRATTTSSSTTTTTLGDSWVCGFCGDVNDSGHATATDARMLLRRAVGLPGNLSCDWNSAYDGRWPVE